MAAQIFGLDIGRSFIKVVQLKSDGNRKTLVAAGSIATPGDGLKTDDKSQLKKVAQSIQIIINNSKIEGKNCVVAIAEASAVTRLIELPSLTDKELASAINWEADQYIPLPIKDVNLQYTVVSRPQGGSIGKMKVLLIAAPKRVISKYLEVITLSGLTLKAVETESTTLARSLSRINESSSLIVSIGASSTDLISVEGGNVFFSRSISSGGLALTRAVMTEFKLTQSQAEQYKMAYGILEEKLSGKIAAILRPVLDIIISEILKAIEYSRTHMLSGQMGRIVICGGGSYLPGLAEFITEKTSVEVSIGDPWLNFNKEGLILKIPGQGSFYCVATGLALRM